MVGLLHALVTRRPCGSPEGGQLAFPRSRRKGKGRRASGTGAPGLRNSLPIEIRSANTLETFKRLKTHLFRQAFKWCVTNCFVLCCFTDVCVCVFSPALCETLWPLSLKSATQIKFTNLLTRCSRLRGIETHGENRP